jgi:Flp pilus assembly protein TadG
VTRRLADHPGAGRPGRNPRSRESGASLVEAAVIFLPFMALFFALFDFGMALFLTNTMQFAVRQGVRYAVTAQVMTGLGQDASIKSTVDSSSFGFLSYLAPGSPKTVCAGEACITITYYHQDTSVSPSTLTAVTGTGSNAAGNVVQVTASGLQYSWMIPLLRANTPLNISVSSADIMEAQPNGPPTR